MGKRAFEPSIWLVRPSSEDGVGIVCISQRKRSAYYFFAEIPCEIGGRGFAVHPLGRKDLYHVRIGEPDDCSCECLGFLRHGHCKHVVGLLALADRGLI